MKLYIGIDLGTSAMKLLLMDGEGGIKNVVSKEYPLEFPQPGWSQQRAEDWRKALMEGVPELLNGFDGAQVAGIGAGQEGKEYLERTGERTRWTNSIFGGMPTYQMAPSYDSTDLLKGIENLYHLYLPTYVWYVFVVLLGF